MCTFCKKERKKVGEKAPPLTKCTLSSAEDLIKEAMKDSEDEDLKASLDMVDFHAKEVCYHHKCKLEFIDKCLHQLLNS